MTSVNLTRDEAQRRSEQLEVNHYTIDLDLSGVLEAPAEGPHTYGSKTTVKFRALESDVSTFIDLRAAHNVSATLNGEDIDTSGYTSERGLPLTGLSGECELVVTADVEYTTTGEGLHRMVDPVDNEVYLYSQFESADAKRVFACFDQPDLKATYSLTVTAPAHWEVVSNGATENIADAAGAADTKLHTFVETEKMSTYLVALIAGPYHHVSDEFVDGDVRIPLRLLCRGSLAEYLDAERLFTETKQGFAFYHKIFGIPYPFGKYDQIFVPEYNMGAMENAGAVTFLEDYVFRSRVTGYRYERRNETILHEMAHMWFGDLVTMRWWDDLWLNESFATYASVLAQTSASEYTEAWTTFANVEKSWAYRQDQLSSTHPVAADMVDLEAVERNFDGITYAKGASVLKQLVAYVGLDPFLAGLRQYFNDHAWGNATFADLVSALEASSGRDLSDWSDKWLRTTGLNTFRAEVTRGEDGTIAALDLVQGGASPGAGELRMHRIGVGIYSRDDQGKLVRSDYAELDVTGERTAVDELVGKPAGDLILVNDNDLTYCSAKLDDDSLEVVLAELENISDSLARTLAWSALWEMTRNAELPARRFIEVVSRAIGAETHVGVVQKVLGQAHAALSRYADPDWAAAHGWPQFSEAMLAHARAATPGSDYQLAFFTALAEAPLRADERALMRNLLVDDPASQGLEGLEVDTDLRWTILTSLVAGGMADADDIDAELARDNTASGARRAATARASRPEAAAKLAVLDLITRTGAEAPSNAVVRASLAGLPFPGHEHLLAEVERRYLETIDELWTARPGEIALTTSEMLFPAWSIDPDTIARFDAVAADEARPNAQRRTIAEKVDDLRRALAAREADRKAG